MKKKKIFYLTTVSVLFVISLLSLFSINSQDKYYKEKDMTFKKNKNDYIAVYINGDLQENGQFPQTKTYTASLECKDSNGNIVNTSSSVKWNKYLKKWEISVSEVENTHLKCNAYFNNKTSTWNNPSTGSLLAAIKSSNPTISSPVTVPGKKKSNDDEAILASAEDDYGTSYYFRGAVENNYVIFAHMCWRIVRVDGRSNIKIILYNYNPDGIKNPCADSEKGTGKAYARYDNTFNGVDGRTLFNSTGKNANVGFMYGDTVADKGSMTDIQAYDQEHENKYESKALTALKKWYVKALGENADIDYSDYLADVVWCADKSLAKQSFNFNNSYTNLGYGSEKTHYGADDRLASSTSGLGPTFKCPDASGTDKNLSRFTTVNSSEGNKKLTYPIGLLTADEAVYAGAVLTYQNKTFYLYGNTGEGTVALNYSWWLLSPRNYSGTQPMMGYINIYGGYENRATNAAFGLRPVVALVPTTDILSGGDGSSSNPFVID